MPVATPWGCGGLSCAYTQLYCLLEGRYTSSLLQGHPPSLRFGHPDVATDGTDPSAHTRLAISQKPERRQPSPAPHAKHQPPSNRLKGDSPPPPQFARHGAHTLNHRTPQRTGGIPRAPEPQMRRGAGGHVGSAPCFPKRPQGVTRTLSAAKRGRAERPGDGCPCVGAEETCGAHHQK